MLKQKILHRYLSRKKCLTPEVWEKIITSKSPIPPSPTNVQWSCQPFRGWGMKRIWYLSKCHPSTKRLAGVHHVVVFKTKVLHFKIENTTIKDTNGQRKFNGMLSFLFVDRRKLLISKNSTTDLWLVLKQPRQRGFGRNLRYILYSKVKESTFLKGNFCIYKSFMDVFYILTSAWKKNHKICIWNWFFAMCLTRGGVGGVLDQFLGVSRWGFETLTLFRTKFPKTHTLFRKTSSILVPCLGQLPQFYY